MESSMGDESPELVMALLAKRLGYKSFRFFGCSMKLLELNIVTGAGEYGGGDECGDFS